MILPPDVLQEIVGTSPNAQQVAASGGDQRTDVRYEVRTRAAAARVGADGTPATPIKVLLRDISSSGVALLHPQPFKRGERFILTLPARGHYQEQGQHQVTLHCAVAHCQEAGVKSGLFVVGAKFVSAPPPPQDDREAAAPTGEAAASLVSRIRAAILK